MDFKLLFCIVLAMTFLGEVLTCQDDESIPQVGRSCNKFCGSGDIGVCGFYNEEKRCMCSAGFLFHAYGDRCQYSYAFGKPECVISMTKVCIHRQVRYVTVDTC